MAAENPISDNQKAFNKWVEVSNGETHRFVAFVDGDPVESGNDFQIVATNASTLASLRGKDANLDIYDVQTQVVTSH